MEFKISFLLYLASVKLCNSTNPPTVRTAYGLVSGSYTTTRGGRQVVQFLGIPYAKPPVGRLRLQSPQNPDSWSGVLNATKECNMCIQQFTLIEPTSKLIRGAEDCLCLNVFSPLVSESAKLPVIIYIHGGAYQGRSSAKSDFGPGLLLDKDVVLVTLNYRLGVMGFLSTADEVLPGNYGLKDQLAALRWVNGNIESFGGDKDLVTLMGQSSGAASVHLHTMSPASRGLFHRGIMQSGSALSTWGFTSPSVIKQKAAVIGDLLGCSAHSSQAFLDCLQQLPAETVVDVYHKLVVWDIDPIVYLSPTEELEGVTDAFIQTNPRASVPNPVPLMVGFNSAEGGFKYLSLITRDTTEKFLKWNGEYDTLTPISLMYNWSSPNVNLVTRTLTQFYLGNKSPITAEMKKGIMEVINDKLLHKQYFE